MEVGSMILVCIVLAAVILLAFLGYLGLFSKVDVKTGVPPFRELTVCYKFDRGPYKGSGRFFAEICSIAPELKSIGLYYDDPELVSSDKLRYAVGAVLSDGVTPEPDGVRERVTQHGFRVITFPAIEQAVLSSVPDRGSLSVLLAIWKVYPALREYMKKRSLCAWPTIELCGSAEVQYVAPLARQEDFLVPEATD